MIKKMKDHDDGRTSQRKKKKIQNREGRSDTEVQGRVTHRGGSKLLLRENGKNGPFFFFLLLKESTSLLK